MANIPRVVLGAALALTAGAASAAPVLIDDFDDGLYSGWTTQAGTADESGGTLGGSNMSLFTRDGLTGSSFTIEAMDAGGVSYAAIVLNYASTADNLFVKIQDNGGADGFDTVFVYSRNNSGSAASPYRYDLGTDLMNATLGVTDNGDGTIDIAVLEASFAISVTTLTNPVGSGAGVGLGFYGGGRIDAFYAGTIDAVAVPVPASIPMLAVGLGMLGALRRRAVRPEV